MRQKNTGEEDECCAHVHRQKNHIQYISNRERVKYQRQIPLKFARNTHKKNTYIIQSEKILKPIQMYLDSCKTINEQTIKDY